jgi:hypothetical protein
MLFFKNIVVAAFIFLLLCILLLRIITIIAIIIVINDANKFVDISIIIVGHNKTAHVIKCRIYSGLKE